jgi:glycosyltransferase involved in cell wall biosynthesis
MVSVVVPVRNSARFIAQALETAVAQQDVGEILVVDDGSTDGSGSVAASFQATRVIRQEPHGPGAARNVGVREARGDVIAFLDADDLWLPGKLALQLAELERTPRCSLCVCAFEQFLEGGCAPPPGFRHATTGVPLRAPLLSALVLRREAFLDVGPFDEGLATTEDIEWFFRAEAAGFERAMVDRVLVRKRVHDRNTSFVSPGNSERLLAVLAAKVRSTHS